MIEEMSTKLYNAPDQELSNCSIMN